jgi:threonine aldolase
MGNTIAVKLHTRHGQEVICEARSHVLNYELAMMAWFSGCVARPIHAEDGILTWDQIRGEIRPLARYYAPTGLVELENTHNMAGGSVMPLEVADQICDGVHDAGLKVHLDGARIFNAATFLGIDVKRLTAKMDTVMFCLSKALGAPIGSLLVGTAEDMAQARLYRKRLGGGMRQAGVLAAAGLIALEEMPSRLHQDHANARALAEGLAKIPGIRVDLQTVATNIVVFDVGASPFTAAEVSGRLKQRGVLINPVGQRRMRAVTHYDADRESCARALEILAEAVAS